MSHVSRLVALLRWTCPEVFSSTKHLLSSNKLAATPVRLSPAMLRVMPHRPDQPDGDSEQYRSCWRIPSVRHDDGDIVVGYGCGEWFVKHQRFFCFSLFCGGAPVLGLTAFS